MIDTAILNAITDCLRLDSKVVAFAHQNTFLNGLKQEFADRVKDYNGVGLTGLALGTAVAGLKPILKFDSSAQFIAAYQFFSDVVSKLPTISNGNLDAPLVTFCPSGPGHPWGLEHDNALESLAAKIDGLNCFFATTDGDIPYLLNQALMEEKPTLILYSLLESEEDDFSYTGKDLTVIAWGHNYKRALRIAKQLDADLTLLNLKSISPLDKEAIIKAVSRTHRVAVISDGSESSSFGSEIAAFIQKEALDELDAPVLNLPFWYKPAHYLSSIADYDEAFTEHCATVIKGLLSD